MVTTQSEFQCSCLLVFPQEGSKVDPLFYWSFIILSEPLLNKIKAFQNDFDKCSKATVPEKIPFSCEISTYSMLQRHMASHVITFRESFVI